MIKFPQMRFLAFMSVLFLLPSVLMAGVYTVTNSESKGPGSLADAVNQANLVPGPHQINFAIPGPGVQGRLLRHRFASASGFGSQRLGIDRWI